jgi:hypothetical protein
MILDKPKIEFSKIIMIIAGIINIIVIVFAIIMIYKTCDLSPFAYLIPSVAAEVATGTAFYYNKAKIENKIKLMSIYNIKPTEECFNNDEKIGGYQND